MLQEDIVFDSPQFHLDSVWGDRQTDGIDGVCRMVDLLIYIVSDMYSALTHKKELLLSV